jgi:hypothetical protein
LLNINSVVGASVTTKTSRKCSCIREPHKHGKATKPPNTNELDLARGEGQGGGDDGKWERWKTHLVAENARENPFWVGSFEGVDVSVADSVGVHLEPHLTSLRKDDANKRRA